MKVSEVIKNLQEFMEENGDMECYCASGTVRDSMTGDFLDERRDCNEILYKPQLSSEYFCIGLDNKRMRIFEKVCILN